MDLLFSIVDLALGAAIFRVVNGGPPGARPDGSEEIVQAGNNRKLMNKTDAPGLWNSPEQLETVVMRL
jgi:hypothetical protein